MYTIFRVKLGFKGGIKEMWGAEEKFSSKN
jgi:hypothetical protein